jgi:hypothetical protein
MARGSRLPGTRTTRQERHGDPGGGGEGDERRYLAGGVSGRPTDPSGLEKLEAAVAAGREVRLELPEFGGAPGAVEVGGEQSDVRMRGLDHAVLT